MDQDIFQTYKILTIHRGEVCRPSRPNLDCLIYGCYWTFWGNWSQHFGEIGIDILGKLELTFWGS